MEYWDPGDEYLRFEDRITDKLARLIRLTQPPKPRAYLPRDGRPAHEMTGWQAARAQNKVKDGQRSINQKFRALTDKRWAAMVEAARLGKTVRQAAEAGGIPYQRLCRYLRVARSAVYHEQLGGAPLTPELKRLIAFSREFRIAQIEFTASEWRVALLRRGQWIDKGEDAAAADMWLYKLAVDRKFLLTPAHKQPDAMIVLMMALRHVKGWEAKLALLADVWAAERAGGVKLDPPGTLHERGLQAEREKMKQYRIWKALGKGPKALSTVRAIEAEYGDEDEDEDED